MSINVKVAERVSQARYFLQASGERYLLAHEAWQKHCQWVRCLEAVGEAMPSHLEANEGLYQVMANAHTTMHDAEDRLSKLLITVQQHGIIIE